MGEEVRITDYDVSGGDGSGGGEEDERVSEWEDGLPNGDDLTPLSQLLISSELLSAFNITPERYRSVIDVNRASQNTISNLQPSLTRFNSSTSSFKGDESHAMDVEGGETADLTPGGSGCRKLQRIGSGDGDSGGSVVEMETEIETESDLQTDDPSARVMKRPRLVWTPQLHKRFIEVVAHLGVKNAVPKTIMQLMNVEGLTRENVASHLQKYRLYLKRMQSLSASGSDQLYSVQNSHESGGSRNGYGYHPMPYAPYQMNSEFNANSYHYGFDSGNHHGMTPNRK